MRGNSEVAQPAERHDPERGLDADGARVARWTFAGLSVVALVFYLVVGRHIWFLVDDWEFLAGRSLNLHGLLDDHGGHFVALPVVVFRVLFAVFGLRSYLPYQAVIVVVHITTAWLLRAVIRRAGVQPWIATAAASLFLFFGSGGQNILQAFQITLVGALAFGLAQFLLADHDGPIDRRDWFGLAMGFGAIACSGVGVTMLVVVGVGALIRRGWRAAVFHVVPPFAVWLIWWQRYATKLPTPTVTLLFRWTRRGLEASFNAMGSVPLVGWALAAVLVVGLVFAWRSFPSGGRRDAAVPAAFLTGVAAFLVSTGVSRWFGGLSAATSPRYLYIVAALLMPPLAVAADALARRTRMLVPVMIVLLLVGIPGNLSKTTDRFQPASRYRQMMLSVARSPWATLVPRSLRPEPNLAPAVTIGWLLDGIRSGRVPKPPPSTPRDRMTYALQIGLEELDRGDGRKCGILRGPTDRTLRPGESLVVRGSVAVALLTAARRPLSDFVAFGGRRSSHTLLAVVRPLSLRIVPRSAGASAC
jgi:hypothetical protein